MKKLFICIFILFYSAMFLHAEVIEKTYYFGEYEIVEVNGYQTINFKNTLLTGKIGEPVLPYHSVSILLPPGEVAESIEITGNYETVIPGNFQLYPKQYSRPISEGSSREFVKNTEIYESISQYPEILNGELSTHFMNGYSFALCTFTPLKYFPGLGKLSFFKTMTVRIFTKTKSKSYKALNNLNSSNTILERVKKLAQNSELISQYPQKVILQDDYQMLIITPEQFENDYQELIDLYFVRGVKTEVATIEYIDSSVFGQDLQEKIRNYIIQEYQDQSIEYVLLGGDVEHVPYRGFYCTVQSSSLYEDDNIPADLYYSALDGTWNDDGDNLWGEIGEDDLLPEVSVARFTISDLDDLNILLNKTISYQDNPVLGELTKSFLAGEHLWDDPPTWGGDYLDLLIGYHDDNGYITNGIPEEHDIETLYDRDVGQWDITELLTKINEGKSFIHHSGHANTGYVMRLNSNQITNSNFSLVNGTDHNYTSVYTHGCSCGGFDENDCIAERMINIDNFAVAFVGNSRYGWFNEGQTEGPSAHLHREFINALYSDKLGRIGTTHLESKIATAPWVNAPGQHEEGALRWCFYDCNVIGDPAMSIWTEEPTIIQASYQDTIPIGQPLLEVNVSSYDDSTDGLTCSLIKDCVIHGIGITDNTGYAEIIIDPIITEVGDAELIISGYNCLPTIFPVTVIPNENACVVLNDFEVVDDNNNIPEYDETISLNITLENVGLEEATDVIANILTGDEFVTITDGEENVGNIPPETIITINNAFEMQIADNIPDQHQINSEIEIISDTKELWNYSINITVNAPNLSVEEIMIDDSFGNNNGIIDPGETVIITIPTYNIGHAISPFAIASLVCDNELITIENDSISLGQINCGSYVNAIFTVNASEEIVFGTLITLIYEATSGGYICQQDFIQTIGLNIEDFETGDFSSYSWEFGGNADWIISSDAYEGEFCSQSGNIGNSQYTSLIITLDVLSNDEISFWKRVSSENNYDYLKFYIDGNLQDQWSGEVSWSNEIYSLSSGYHTFEWKYIKDTYVSSGSDCVWIDYIIFPAIGVPTSIENEEAVFLTTYKIFQNKPNPFKKFTNIDYFLPQPSNVEIRIYNIKGQIIKKYEVRNAKCGMNKAEWNGEDENGNSASSGIYFYQFIAGEFIDIRKCILLK